MKQFRILLGLIVSASFITASPLVASIISASDYQTIPVRYQGTITRSPIDDIQIRMPDGSIAPYTGPVPDYPFKAGDPITISFDALVPSRQAIDRGLIPQSSDGIYQFELRGGIGDNNDFIFDAGQIAQFGPFGRFGNITGNGNIDQATDNNGEPEYGTGGGIAIVYDSNSDSYHINTNFYNRPDGTISAVLGFIDSAVLDYDISENRLTGFVISERGGGNNLIELQGGGKARIPALGYSGISDSSGNPIGTRLLDNSLFFDGAFNLPFFGNQPQPVPAPSVLLLFGIGAGALAWRRRPKV